MSDAPKAEGLKADTGKPPCELFSPIAYIGTSMVLAFGARKYAANNWRLGLPWTKIIGAIFRHLLAISAGEDLDPESGLPHIDHLGCEVMFLQEYFRTSRHLDDRYKLLGKDASCPQYLSEYFKAPTRPEDPQAASLTNDSKGVT